jgi:SHS2 domain-containing protein
VFHLTERPGEIEMKINDVDLEGLFDDAVLALGDVFSDAAAARGRPVTHEVELTAGDTAALFGAWIRELVALAEAQGFVPERVEKLALANDAVRARVAGERGIARELIKPVASHRIEVEALEDATWSATVVLDVAR